MSWAAPMEQNTLMEDISPGPSGSTVFTAPATPAHELHRHADPVPRLADAPLEDRGDAERLADLGDRRVLALEVERRRAGSRRRGRSGLARADSSRGSG